MREYRIGEAARLVGISPSALRLWERQGLVRPTRTLSGYRLYRDTDIDQLRDVHLMRTQRVNAPGIRRLIRTPADARPSTGRLSEPSRIRRLRLERGMSLRAASLRSGLSVSFLSALERGTRGASVATMQRLTRAFGLTVLDLFEPAKGIGRHVRPRQRRVLELDGGVRIEQLATGASALESQLFILAPGASSEGQYAHGGEEFLYVLDGDVTFWIGSNERYRLVTGDALSFPSTLPHRWRNRTDGETRLLWINTPPTF